LIDSICTDTAVFLPATVPVAS